MNPTFFLISDFPSELEGLVLSYRQEPQEQLPEALEALRTEAVARSMRGSAIGSLYDKYQRKIVDLSTGLEKTGIYTKIRGLAASYCMNSFTNFEELLDLTKDSQLVDLNLYLARADQTNKQRLLTRLLKNSQILIELGISPEVSSETKRRSLESWIDSDPTRQRLWELVLSAKIEEFVLNSECTQGSMQFLNWLVKHNRQADISLPALNDLITICARQGFRKMGQVVYHEWKRRGVSLNEIDSGQIGSLCVCASYVSDQTFISQLLEKMQDRDYFEVAKAMIEDDKFADLNRILITLVDPAFLLNKLFDYTVETKNISAFNFLLPKIKTLDLDYKLISIVVPDYQYWRRALGNSEIRLDRARNSDHQWVVDKIRQQAALRGFKVYETFANGYCFY